VRGEWVELSPPSDLVQKLSRQLRLDPLIARLLINRGITAPEEIKKFLSVESTLQHDPYQMEGMDEAVSFLLKVRDSGRKISIFGDYDVDGITGTAVLFNFLNAHGWKVDYYIPDRIDEGYGLSADSIDYLAERGTSVILTVDCGITSVEAVERARFKGIDVIITDHHEPREVLPPAVAILDPKRVDDPYPFKELAGVGVAYKLVFALASAIGVSPEEVEKLLEFVSLGTVADIVPLIDENRYYVRRGMELLARSRNVGLQTLIKLTGLQSVATSDIAYKLAPKLNAAGRMHKATVALELLLERDERRAWQLASELLKHNAQRQNVELEIYEQALKKLESDPRTVDSPVLVVAGKSWHPGVIGIVASRLVSKFDKPVVIFSVDGEYARGSARSPEGINIMDLFQGAADLLVEFGGHSYAAGVTIETTKIEAFTKRLNMVYREKYGDYKFTRKMFVDARLDLRDLNERFFKALDLLRPYGQGNPEPVFRFDDLSVRSIRFTRNNEHVKFVFASDGIVIPGIGFGLSSVVDEYPWMQGAEMRMNVLAKVRLDDHTGFNHAFLEVVDLDVRLEGAYAEELRTRRFISGLFAGWQKQAFTESPEPEGTFMPHLARKFIARTGLTSEREIELVDGFCGDYKSRNAFIAYTVLRAVSQKKKVLVVSPSNILLKATMLSIDHMLGELEFQYVNSLSRVPKKCEVLFATTAVVLKHPEWFSHYEVVVIDSVEAYERRPRDMERLIANVKRWAKVVKLVASQESKLVESVATELDLKETVHIKSRRPTIGGIIDERDRFSTNDQLVELFSRGERVSLVFSSTKKVYNVARRINRYLASKGREYSTLFYSHQLKPFQKRFIRSLIEQGKVDVLVTSPFTDGLSTLNGDATIVFIGPPKTPLELIDAVSSWRSEAHPLLYLAYSKAEVEKAHEELRGLFPSLEEVSSVVERFDGSIPKKAVEASARLKVMIGMLSEMGKLEDRNGTYKVKKFSFSSLAASSRFNEAIYDLPILKQSLRVLTSANVRALLEFLNEQREVFTFG